MADRIKLRRDTAANWTATNPVLAQGEPGFETDTGYMKIGDGSTAWTSLAYFGGGASGDFVSKTGDTMTGPLSVPAGAGGAQVPQAQEVALLATTQLAGHRNRIINGNFAINQRGYVSGTATSGANQYTLDRWRVVTSGQNLTFSASGNGNQVTAPAGGIEQVIEGANIEGGTYVINWTGTATCTINGTARTKGESFTLTANTNATVKFSSGTVSKVQLEPGAAPTVFEHRLDELKLCQRYANAKSIRWRWDDSWNVGVGLFYTDHFPQMMASPSVSIVSNASSGFTGLTVHASTNSCVVFTMSASATGPVARELNAQVLYISEL